MSMTGENILLKNIGHGGKVVAEFLGQKKPPPLDGFNAMGHPIPNFRKQAGYDCCKQMGLNTDEAWGAVNGMSEALARDMPYEAMAAGMRYIDLTGTYRLMAVLLVTPKPKVSIHDIKTKR